MKQKEATIRRRRYDEDFKRSALRMIENGQSVRSLALAPGVGGSQLHRWKRQDWQTPSAPHLEVVGLRAPLRQVEMGRDILKKALSISPRQS